jgi:hypothetical protein
VLDGSGCGGALGGREVEVAGGQVNSAGFVFDSDAVAGDYREAGRRRSDRRGGDRVTLGVAALGTLIAGGDDWSLGAALLGQTTLIQIVSMLVGLGFGALLMNPALAIVTYLALPTVWSILGVTITGLGPATEWLDLKVASMPLTEASVTTGEWARFGVAVAVWAGLTVVLCTVRAMRREVA